MIPGKKYRPEDFLKIAYRQKWVIIVPLIVSAIGTFVWSRTLPDVYRSEATVLIVPQQVPENYIRTTITETLKDRIELIRQQILSRSRLEPLILELNLYPQERKELLMDEVVDQMRRDVNVTVAKAGRRQDPDYFTVTYDSENAQTAMQVAERLASLFIRDNLAGRTAQTDTTIVFLQSQVDESLRQLQAHETRLEVFRRANAGRLPDEVATNLHLMQSSRQEIQSMAEGIQRDRERQIVVERLIADEMAFGAVSRNKVTGDGKQAGLTAAQELAAGKTALATLQLRLKDDHPDVRIAKSRIAELEKKASLEALQQPIGDGVGVAILSSADAERERRLSGYRAELQSLERDMSAKRAKGERAQKALAEHERRVQVAPALESQLSGLMRDYGTLKSTYENLLAKSQNAKLASNLEERQVGEQFKIIDPARRPERPRSPDRGRMNLIGAIIGLGFGLAIAGLLEYRDTSLRTEEDVLVALSLPVVALVPTMWTPDELKRVRRRRLWLIGSSAVATLALSAMALAWKTRLLQNWIR